MGGDYLYAGLWSGDALTEHSAGTGRAVSVFDGLSPAGACERSVDSGDDWRSLRGGAGVDYAENKL